MLHGGEPSELFGYEAFSALQHKVAKDLGRRGGSFGVCVHSISRAHYGGSLQVQYLNNFFVQFQSYRVEHKKLSLMPAIMACLMVSLLAIPVTTLGSTRPWSLVELQGGFT